MQPLGPARARNAALRFRQPGQDWMFVDSDIEFLTEGWLAKMLDTLHVENRGVVTPAILNADGTRPFGGVEPYTGLHTRNHAPVGARLCRGDLVDIIGAQRSYGLYGCEDLDYDERTRAAGFQIVWDSDVVVSHPGTPSDDDWKRQKLEECIPCFKEWEEHYRAGRFLYEAAGSEDTPRPPRAVTDSGWGSHLPYLQAAMELVDGPVLEVGAGLYSTPALSKRTSVTVETDPRWAKWAKSQGADVRGDLPDGAFAVALIDGPEDTRAESIRALRGRVKVFVVHDTEHDGYGYEPMLSTFAHRFDSEDLPRTTVVSDDFALDGLATLFTSGNNNDNGGHDDREV